LYLWYFLITLQKENTDNEVKEDLDFSHDISSKQFVNFKTLLGSPISFGPFEANLETHDEILPQGRDSIEAYVPNEIKSSESPLGIYQAKESTTRTMIDNIDASQQPQQPQQPQPVYDNTGIPFPCEEQNNFMQMQHSSQSIQQSQLNSQFNDTQFDLKTSQQQSQNKPNCQYNLTNSQLLNQQKNQFMMSQEGSQVQEVMPLVQQNQICQQQFQQSMPYSSSHVQQNNYNSSHDMKIQNMTEIFNCPSAQPYIPPPTQQMSYQCHQSYPQQMTCPHHMMQPSWQNPSLIPTQTNHQIMPLQPSTRYNQMQYNQMQYNQTQCNQMQCNRMQYNQPMNSYREMLPFHSTGIVMPQFMPSHQMQHDQMPQVSQTPMINDRQPSVCQMGMYDMRQVQNPILQHHQMNWRAC
jgi:hypothetical protein